VKADRTVILFGAFLFLVGLAVAWNGYGYVQVERGWTLVIAGTVAFCTGLILIAAGLLLRELEAISASTAKSALFLAKARSNGLLAPGPAQAAPAPLTPPPVAEAEPFIPGVIEDEEIAPQAQSSYAPHPLAPRAVERAVETVRDDEPILAPKEVGKTAAKEPSQDERKTPAWMSRATSYVSTFAAARAAASVATPKEDKPSADESHDWLEQAIAEESAHSHAAFVAQAEAQAAAVPASEAARKAAEEPVSDHTEPHEPAPASETGAWRTENWLEEGSWSESKHWTEPGPKAAMEADDTQQPSQLEGAEPEEVAETAHDDDAYHEVAPGQAADDEAGSLEEVAESAPETAHEHEREPLHETEQEFEPRPAIIGRYEAHGTHYTMYADGSIDAETAHGVYRFASMEELKRFIEKSE
jgi:hypothetical protein